jgi:hypothetical protein
MGQFALDIEEDTAEIVVEFNSTMAACGFIFQTKHCLMTDINENKGWTRIWKAIALF